MSDYKIDTLEVESQIIAPAATTSVAGLQSPTDKTKLDGVATGATANSTDAQLRDRSTHTGLQLSTTISDFSTAASVAAPVQSVAGQTGTVVLSKTDVGLANVDNTSDATKNSATATLINKTIDAASNTVSNISNTNISNTAAISYSKLSIADGDLTVAKTSGLQTALNNKYDASNPNGYQTASQVSATVAALVDAAPAALDTLNELAAALGDDPNFASTVTTSLAGKEPTITAGTAAQYYRGDKSFQTLDKTAVGLSNIDNTSDANKPISTATQTALNLKYDATNPLGYQTTAQVTSTVSAASITDRDRTNHTGTQTSATISDFSESVDDRVASLLTAGTNITLTYNDAANTLTIDSAAGSAYTDEQAQDAVGTILTDSSSVDLTYNDVANTITAAVLPAGVNHNALQNYVANEHVNHSTVSINAGTGLSGGGDITATRTLNIANTTVTAGSYGSATNVPTFTVNAQGQITSATNTAITFPVTSVFGRSGIVVAQTNDYTFAQIDKTISSLADLTTRSAGDLSSGTLLDARLSTNVPLKNAVNVFTGSIEISSTTQGFLLPRMTTAQRLAIVSPAEGLFVFDTDFNTLCEYSGTSWKYEVRVNTTAIQTSTSTTYANITEFTTLGLEVGLYVLELKGIMQSTATTTGVGLRLAAGTATISSVVLNWGFSLAAAGTDKMYEYSQLTTADNVISTAVLTANTNLPVFGNGVFRLSVAGTVVVQLRSETNGVGISIRPDSTFMLKKVG